MKRLLFIFALATMMIGAKADDFGLWTDVNFEQNLGVKGLDANIGLGFRTNNDVRNVNRWSASAGLEYSICSYLKVAATYSYLYNYYASERKENYKSDGVTWEGWNYTHAYWRSRNRFSFDLKTGFDLGRFSFSLRERYQLTRFNTVGTIKDKYRKILVYDTEGNLLPESELPNQQGYPSMGERDSKNHKSKEYLRSRIGVSYDIRNCTLTPSLSVEFENNLRNACKLDEVRYAAEVEWKISKKVRLGASYLFNASHDADAEEDEDTHAIEISLKFKNLFWKAKK